MTDQRQDPSSPETGPEDGHRSPPGERTNPAVRYEQQDAHVLLIGAFGIALLISLVACYFISDFVSQKYIGDRAAMLATNGVLIRDNPQLPPEPRLQGAPGHQTNPVREARELKERAERRLGSYGWVDREQRIAHIPIDAAMELFLNQQQNQREQSSAPADHSAQSRSGATPGSDSGQEATATASDLGDANDETEIPD